MGNTMMEKVTVDSLSKYGIKVGNEYYNWSKNINEAEKGRVVPGAAYDMELFIAESGKKYINKVIGGRISTLPPVVKVDTKDRFVVPEEPPKKFTPAPTLKPPVAKAAETMTKADWGAKDRSQLIGGLSHDAAMLVAAMVPVLGALDSIDGVVKAHKTVLEGLLKNREEVK